MGYSYGQGDQADQRFAIPKDNIGVECLQQCKQDMQVYLGTTQGRHVGLTSSRMSTRSMPASCSIAWLWPFITCAYGAQVSVSGKAGAQKLPRSTLYITYI